MRAILLPQRRLAVSTEASRNNGPGLSCWSNVARHEHAPRYNKGAAQQGVRPVKATGDSMGQQVVTATRSDSDSDSEETFNVIASMDLREGVFLTDADEYRFSEHQLEVISELRKEISGAYKAFAALAITNVVLSILTAEEGRGAELWKGLTLGDFAFWGDSFMMCLLAKYALEPFDRVLSSKKHQMQYVFNGLTRLDLIFQQLAITAFSVSVVTALDAATTYPPIVKWISLGFFGLGTLRSLAMWWVLSKHASSNEEVVRTLGQLRGDRGRGVSTTLPTTEERPSLLMELWEKTAVLLAFGYLAEYEESMNTKSAGGGADPEYVFTPSEDRVLKSMVDSASTAALMVTLQAFAVLMLTVAEAGVNDTPGMVSDGINFCNKAITAYFIVTAIGGADRAMHAEDGGNVDHLLESMGEKGWAGLFEHLSKLAIAVALANTVGFFLPFIEEDALSAGLADGASEVGAGQIMSALRFGVEVVEQL